MSRGREHIFVEGRGLQSAPLSCPYKGGTRLATGCAAGLMRDHQCQNEGMSIGHPAHQSFFAFSGLSWGVATLRTVSFALSGQG